MARLGGVAVEGKERILWDKMGKWGDEKRMGGGVDTPGNVGFMFNAR
jgi:hypothetical protein